MIRVILVIALLVLGGVMFSAHAWLIQGAASVPASCAPYVNNGTAPFVNNGTAPFEVGC